MRPYHAVVLQRIITDTRRRLAGLQAREPELRTAAASAGPVREFASALEAGGVGVIAEVKRRSPSRGDLNPDLHPGSLAACYERAGAAAVSVLTEPFHFDGSDRDLREARAAVRIPVLRKDFVVHPIQVLEARALGADAVLLIVGALDDDTLASLIEETQAAGMDALVEVHNRKEAQRALDAGALVIGVNNRDLTTFDTDLTTAEALAPVLADARVRVAESGIHSTEDVERMTAVGYHAVLVGESLVTAPDPAAAIRSLLGRSS